MVRKSGRVRVLVQVSESAKSIIWGMNYSTIVRSEQQQGGDQIGDFGEYSHFGDVALSTGHAIARARVEKKVQRGPAVIPSRVAGSLGQILP
jgi:hypothetical protein